MTEPSPSDRPEEEVTPRQDRGAEGRSSVEMAIRRAQADGAFDAVPGRGQPLQEDDATAPAEWRRAFHMLKSAGFAPGWIEGGREIRDAEADLVAMADGFVEWFRREQAAARKLPPEEAAVRRRLGLAAVAAATALALAAAPAMARPVEPVSGGEATPPSGPYDGPGMGVGRDRAERDALPPSPQAAGRIPWLLADAVTAERPSPWQRLTPSARSAPPASPFHATTWVSFYGRPGVEVMGVLGEHDLDALVGLMRIVASEYDAANGPRLGVKPAFHLVYGMATNRKGNSGQHLSYLSPETTALYVDRAAEEGYGVILDIQIGALSPAEAVAPALDWLERPGVHLALDPEFAMTEEVQDAPGNPIGHVTGDEINEVQRVVRQRMAAKGIKEHKMVIVHQFLASMIADREAIEAVPGVDIVVSMDGFGHPRAKIGKYNLYTDGLPFAALKLFYRWDEPLLSPAQALGGQDPGTEEWIQTLPNLVIYQ